MVGIDLLCDNKHVKIILKKWWIVYYICLIFNLVLYLKLKLKIITLKGYCIKRIWTGTNKS